MKEAADLLERANAIRAREGAMELVATSRATLSLRLAMVGDEKRALALAAASVRGAWPDCLLTYATVGDQSRVGKLLPKFAAAPAGGFFSFDVAPYTACINGVLQLRVGKPDEALKSLEAGPLYERATRYWLVPQYERANALLAAKRPADAVAEFQKLIALRSIAPYSMAWPLAHVGLAGAYAAAGNAGASRKAYEDFFALWKDADPDVPILVAARKEYAALK